MISVVNFMGCSTTFHASWPFSPKNQFRKILRSKGYHLGHVYTCSQNRYFILETGIVHHVFLMVVLYWAIKSGYFILLVALSGTLFVNINRRICPRSRIPELRQIWLNNTPYCVTFLSIQFLLLNHEVLVFWVSCLLWKHRLPKK